MPTSMSSERAAEIGRRGAQTKKLQAVERRIRELVDAAPPLTPAQRDRLALLLRAPSGGDAG